MRKAAITLLAILVPQMALGCACCMETGERFQQQWEVDSYAIAEFAQLENKGEIQLFTSSCDLECVRGITNPKYQYSGDLRLDGGMIRLSIADAGQISMPIGKEFTRFGVDLDPFGGQISPTVYTEFRFKGKVDATGDFAPSQNALAELVLVGSSNWCWVAGDFAHWSLQLSGDNADFRLFGQLAVSDQ